MYIYMYNVHYILPLFSVEHFVLVLLGSSYKSDFKATCDTDVGGRQICLIVDEAIRELIAEM